MAQQFRYPALVKLNNTELTDESRGPLQESRDERAVTVDLASGRKRKFIQGIRKKWDMTWENVAIDAASTVDGKAGRNEIRVLAQTGGTLTLTIQDGVNPDEVYSVFIDSYSDDVVMRRGPGDMRRYTVNLSLVEEG